jgi:transcriptional regulator with XRE-family HTH domain
MDALAGALRTRAQELGLSHAAIARRIGVSERRYANYVTGRNEPDLATLVWMIETWRSPSFKPRRLPHRNSASGRRVG